MFITQLMKKLHRWHKKMNKNSKWFGSPTQCLILDNKEAFCFRDEIGTCPYFEVKLELRDDKPIFCSTLQC